MAGSAPTADADRTAELQASLTRVRARIADACRAADRDPAAVILVAVTKFFPLEDARRLVELGAVDLGESRDQEARPKAEALAEAHWHFIGRLQKNKARSVATYADVVHSVDRTELADALAAGVRRAERDPLTVFAQVNLDEDDPAQPDGATRRGGAPLSSLHALIEHIAARPELDLAGVMAIAPPDVDPAAAFARLAEASHAVQQRFPDARAVSAGMSGDLEAAIAAGATHVRVGTALLGPRPGNVG